MVYRPQVRACQNTGTVCGTPVCVIYGDTKRKQNGGWGVGVACFAVSFLIAQKHT